MDIIGEIQNSQGLQNTLAFQIDFILRLVVNFAAIFIIARKIYFSRRGNRDYMFTMFIFNIVIFIICFVLNSASLSVGFAFGIFAIFSILRYRTYTVPIRDMTYMFVAIAIAVLNALSSTNVPIYQLIFINVFVALVVFITDKSWIRREHKKVIRYEKIDLIRPDKRDELIQDLRARTGLNVNRVDIGTIDFLRDVAMIRIYYSDNQ